MTDLETQYAPAFGGHLEWGARPALLLVDMARAYVDKESVLYAAGEDALASAIQLVDAARRASIPIVYTQVVYRRGGVEGGLFFKKVPALTLFEEGHPMGRFATGIEPLETEIIVTKHYASSFFGTSLASTLHALRVDHLLIGGYSTSGCVRATALDALQNGFAPFVVRDACADRHSGPHEASLFDLQAKYAEVVSAQDALARLDTPQ